MADILRLMTHIDEQGEKGRQQGLARLLGKAYNAPSGQRQEALGRVAQHDGGLAMTAGKAFREEDGEVLSQLSDHAKMVVSLYKSSPQMAQQAYQSMLPLAARVGIANAPTQLDDSLIDGLTQLAQVNDKAGGGGVQSTQIGDDGYFYTVDRATGKFVNSGVKASPSLRVLEQEGQLPYGVVTGRGAPGQVVPLGGAPATQGYAQPSTYNGQAPQTQFTGADGAPVNIDPNLPPQVQAAIRANEGQWAQAPDQSQANIQMPGQPKMSNAGLPGIGQPSVGPVRIPTAAEKAYQAELAKGQAESELAPIRAQAEADKARLVEGAKLDVEREAGAPKRIAKYRQALSTAANVVTSIDKAIKLIGPTTTGFAGARLRGFEGSAAYNLAAEVETIKANLGFDRLQEMRDNSPTGGALGQVAIQELVALQSTVANLDPDQSAEQVRANLERVRDHYARWKAAVEQSMTEEQKGGRQDAPQSNDIDSILTKYGIK